MSTVEKFLESVKVYDVGLTKIRLGNKHDGGYVVLQEICDKAKDVHSFGIGKDIGYELDWVNRHPTSIVHAYDPYIAALPENHKQFKFHKHGIGNGHNPLPAIHIRRNSLLKMDVEWSEWSALSLLSERLSLFSQLLIEFHLVHMEPRENLSPYFHAVYDNVCNKINDDLFTKYCAVMTLLNESFYAYHIHANNSLPMVMVETWRFPPLIELSFVRKDLVSNPVGTESTFPIDGLDYPNKTDRPDILDIYPLGGIGYYEREIKASSTGHICAF